MPNITVRNLKNEPIRDIELPEDVFGAEWNEHVVYEVVKAHLAGIRSGTAATKVRSEVSGSGKKLWKQKHTGRARMGSIRSPIWRKGGTVHGPHPRDYTMKVNVRTKKGALRSVLSQKVSESKLLVLDRIEIVPSEKELKATGRKRLTRSLAIALKGLGVEGKALVVDMKGNENLELATRNNPKLVLTAANRVNVYDVINAKFVVVSEAALTKVTEALR